MKKNDTVGEPNVSSMGPENISMKERIVVIQYLRHWHLYRQGKNEVGVIQIS
jgi:hypothetical protein